MAVEGINRLDALALRDKLARGEISAADLTGACLKEIAAREPQVQAWAWLDSDHAMAEAKRLDALRTSGRPIGALHGLPVGLKDIIDTKGIPTENGTAIDKGRVPVEDAAIVRRLKAAGAVVIGKTVTCELASTHPSKTTNPVNASHTPGGSSAGSAAAVSAGMVPLAVGTQTGGSVIRPAAYCGVVGYKPTFGAVARTGVLAQSPTLDTPGVFGRTVGDVALIAEAIWGGDPGDRHSVDTAPPRLLDTALAKPPVTPTLALVTLPGAADMDPAMAATMEELAGFLGEGAFQTELPTVFGDAASVRERINFAELSKNYYRYERAWDSLSAEVQEWMKQGREISARDYLAALDWRDIYYAGLEEILSRADAIVTPATLGPAPEGLGSTGSAIFNGLFTLAGVPAVTIPVGQAENGLPLGIQLVGRRWDDGRLLRTARWLAERIAGAGDEE